jgi:hypothetical protein
VHALAAEGRSQRQIAEEVFGDGRYRGRVERILSRLPGRDVPPELPRNDGEDFEALLASGGEMAIVAALVARYERSLIESDAVPSLADVERLLRIKLRLDGIATVERLKALTREPRDDPATTGNKRSSLAESDEAWGAQPGAH